ncbi:hypothetical protein SAMN04487920_10291 [Bacillus mycoides]|nr:DNA-binding protein [Bacillus mycoides]SFQ54532.1 hypothetical protein SAMN04487920_10291 [Bacillus mycoides]
MNVFFHNKIGVHEAASILNILAGQVKNLCAEGKIVQRRWVRLG